MEKCLEAYKNELKGLRSGRAHPALLDSIMIKKYPEIDERDTYNDEEAITPWEKMFQQWRHAMIWRHDNDEGDHWE